MSIYVYNIIYNKNGASDFYVLYLFLYELD
jgi:hypothetical protein